MVGYRRKLFQSCLNLRTLFNTQGSEPKSILGSKRPHNLRGNRLFAGFGQFDFERDQLFKCQTVGDERIHPAFAEIARPSLQVKALAVPLEANLNPLLEHMPRRDPAVRTGLVRRSHLSLL